MPELPSQNADVFNPSNFKVSNHGRLTDQADQPLVADQTIVAGQQLRTVQFSEIYQGDSFAPPRDVPTPRFPADATTLNFTDQPASPFSSVPLSRQENPPASSFAPPIDRSGLSFVPKVQVKQNVDTQTKNNSHAVQSEMESALSSAETSGRNYPNGDWVAKTKLTNLKERSQIGGGQAKGAVAGPKESPAFLTREAFSNRFFVSTPQSNAEAKFKAQPGAPLSNQPKIIFLVSDQETGTQDAGHSSPDVLPSAQQHALEQAPESPFVTKSDATPSQALSSDFIADSPESTDIGQANPTTTEDQASLPPITEHRTADDVLEALVVPQTTATERDIDDSTYSIDRGLSEASAKTLQGFTDADLSALDSLESSLDRFLVSQGSPHMNRLAEAGRVKQDPDSALNNPFQFAGYRSKTGISETRTDDAIGGNHIILPKFGLGGTSSRAESFANAASVQQTSGYRSNEPASAAPWLSGWWMLIALIPIALYLVKTKWGGELGGWGDDDRDIGLANPQGRSVNEAGFDFAADFSELGRSKSDAIYGADDLIAGQEFEAIDDQFTIPTSADEFPKSVFFEMHKIDALENLEQDFELSPDQSPNFGAAPLSSKQIESGETKRKAS